tara:strand:- start:46038 stop:46475 length:438 start_codon:yes stop_codon:yes gene_type:complete
MNINTQTSTETPFEDRIPLSHCVYREFETNGHKIYGEFFENELLELVVTKSDSDGGEDTIHHYNNVQGPSVKFDYRVPDGNPYDPFIVKDYEIKVPELMGRIVKLSICDDNVIHLYLSYENRDGTETVIGGQLPPHYNLDETVKN